MALLETGVSADATDLISRMNARLAAEGWTINKFDTTNPDLYELYFSRLIDGDTRYFQAYGDRLVDAVHISGATGFDTGQTFDNQPGKGVSAVTNFISAPIKQYKFWGAASYFYVSVQKQANIFGHFGAGMLVKCGTWIGGEFVFGTNIYLDANGPNYRWDDPHYALHAYPFDSTTGFLEAGSIRADTGFGGSTWHGFSQTLSLKAVGSARLDGLMTKLRARSGPNQFNGQTILLPAYCHVRKQVPQPAWLYAGYPPDLRFVNVGGVAPGEVLTLGPDSWEAIPVLQKNGAATQPNSGIYGMAYKVN